MCPLQDVLEKVDGRTAVINNRDAGSREQVAALLATADALVEANQGAVLPLPRHLASPHSAPLSRCAPNRPAHSFRVESWHDIRFHWRSKDETSQIARQLHGRSPYAPMYLLSSVQERLC